jgi:hypothetical protein
MSSSQKLRPERRREPPVQSPTCCCCGINAYQVMPCPLAFSGYYRYGHEVVVLVNRRHTPAQQLRSTRVEANGDFLLSPLCGRRNHAELPGASASTDRQATHVGKAAPFLFLSCSDCLYTLHLSEFCASSHHLEWLHLRLHLFISKYGIAEQQLARASRVATP